MKLVKAITRAIFVKEKPKEVFVVTPPRPRPSNFGYERCEQEYAERMARMERLTNRQERMRRGERFYGQDDVYAS